MKHLRLNKFALITGASGLLGQYHADALAEIGYNLVLVDINPTQLIKLKKNLSLKFKNVRKFFYQCDITKEKQVKNLKMKLEKNNIFINCLVNNADNNPTMIKGKGEKLQT